MRPKQTTYYLESKVAEEITRMLNSTEKSQQEIAQEIGLTKSNIMTMFKQGRTKLPLKFVVPLSKACGQDPAILMNIALEEYAPEILEAMGDSFKTPTTEYERIVLSTLRRAKKNKEKVKRDKARAKATSPIEERQSSLLRCNVKTEPKDVKALYDYFQSQLID